jgi:hypothetical protein
MKRLLSLAFVVLVTFGAAAVGAPLGPGTLLYPAPSENYPAVLPVADVVGIHTGVFVSPTFSGAITTNVLQNDPLNPFPGGLTFIYSLVNDPQSAHSMNRLSVNGFDGFTLDVVQATSGSLVGQPAWIDQDFMGGPVGFSFETTALGTTPLAPGQVSSRLVIRTNATAWAENVGFVIDGSTAGATILAPIPEPGTAALGACGVALGWLCWRRRSTAARRSLYNLPTN